MTDTLTPLRKLERSEPPHRGRGPLLAIAVAAVLILIVGVATFSLLSGDEQPVATDPPAPTTTVASLPPSPLPADTPPLQIAAALQTRWDSGNVDGGWALFHPDSDAYLADFRPGVDEELWYRWVTGMETTHECELRTPPQLADRTPRVEGAQMVTCVDTITSGLEPGVVVAGGTWAIEVADGWVHDFFIIDFAGALSETNGLDAYRSWMQETIPERYPELFNENTLTVRVDSQEARNGHRELVPFFLADTGPRPERALPADTPLMEIVAEFQRRWDAGDVDGYEALINPEIGYPPGNDAFASWFGVATGVTSERTCSAVDAMTLRCEETVYWGLLPGESSESTVEYVARNGWIMAINFLDGDSALVQSVDAPGLVEYRAWVQDNLPDRFETLFAFGVSMRVDTAELRELHRDTVAEYLAAIG